MLHFGQYLWKTSFNFCPFGKNLQLKFSFSQNAFIFVESFGIWDTTASLEIQRWAFVSHYLLLFLFFFQTNPAMLFFFFHFHFFIINYYYFYFTILYWFCHTSTWICHGSTRVPHPEAPSHLPPHTIPVGHPSAWAPGILYPALNLDWLFVSYMILYMFQCHSPKSSHPLPLPQSPKDCSIHQCLFCCLADRVIITIFLNSTYMH